MIVVVGLCAFCTSMRALMFVCLLRASHRRVTLRARAEARVNERETTHSAAQKYTHEAHAHECFAECGDCMPEKLQSHALI